MSRRRFTDCDKWADPWFMELPPLAKLVWLYLVDCCDNAGVWDVNTKLVEFAIGTQIDWTELLEIYRGRVVVLDGGRKWHLVKFVAFHYPGNLGESHPHKQVKRLLASHGLPVPNGSPVSSVDEKQGGGVASMEASSSLHTIQYTPSPSSKGGAGGSLRRHAAFLGLAVTEDALIELAGFGCRHGAKTTEEVRDCLAQCVGWARKDGQTPRFARDLEKYGPDWTDLKKHETPKIPKAKA